MTCKSQAWQGEGKGGRRGLTTDTLWLHRVGGNGDLNCGKLWEAGRRGSTTLEEEQRRPGDTRHPTVSQRSQ